MKFEVLLFLICQKVVILQYCVIWRYLGFLTANFSRFLKLCLVLFVAGASWASALAQLARTAWATFTRPCTKSNVQN